MPEDIIYEIKKHLGVVSKSKTTEWRKELNLISWNGNIPKFDIRDWAPDHVKMGRGITLTPYELRKVTELYLASQSREAVEEGEQKERERQNLRRSVASSPYAKHDDMPVSDAADFDAAMGAAPKVAEEDNGTAENYAAESLDGLMQSGSDGYSDGDGGHSEEADAETSDSFSQPPFEGEQHQAEMETPF